ncbi:MAG: hypothetical protein IPJ74_02520 [Saprospiraceae bacterium]|nr:hypothetical protein [Saprospiraceae bacterium]
MDTTTLETLKSKLRRLVPESIEEAIAELKTALPEFSPKYNPLLLLESRLNDANLKNVQNLLSDAELQIEYNQIRADLLLLIASLEERDFQLILGTPAAKTGSLLYKIPEQMQLQKETKCLVRLAFEEASIIRNIELNEDVTIKQVRVAEVMQVELIDPSAEHPFEIRSISDEEQFLEKGDYTEWVFYVKPLLEGTFPLVLKISVIEMVQGKERIRNLTWEETIQITTSEPALSASEFKPTGIAVGAAETDILEEPFMPPSAPAIDAMLDMPSPAPIQNIPISPIKKDNFPQIERYEPAPQLKRRPKYRTWLAAAASVLLIVTVAIFMLPNSSAPTDVIENKPSPVMEDSSFVLPSLDSLIQDTSISPQ